MIFLMGLFSGFLGKNGTAFAQEAAQEAGKVISAQEAHKIMNESGDYVLLDVRTQPEYEEVSIRGAKLIPLDELETRAAAEIPDKNVLILVYCRSGARSAGAARLLAQMGYTKVFDFGGIINWPYETVKGQRQ